MDPERERLEQWMAKHFGADILPPFAFIYGGRPSADLLRDWRLARTDNTVTYTDPDMALEVVCT